MLNRSTLKSHSQTTDGKKVLVICNAYPSDKALYRNGFIHRRVKAYQQAGIGVEVFYNHQPVASPYTYKYDGIEVIVGNDVALEKKVKEERFDAFLVHFAEPTRIDPLIRANITAPVIVWVHGFEAEAWHRRWFNFIDSGSAIRAAMEKKNSYYQNQNRFLGDLIASKKLNLTFVNVSEWFQKFVVEPDVGVEFENSEVIPNLVDEQVFPYRKKGPEMRKKFLSIRPFASMKYANDQTVEAVLILSERPYFNDLEFSICGQGPLFEETTAPLKKFKNVKLVNKFFGQEEIAKLHSNNGVFLCPTRFDSQGVSMCEAISSGLVAISTDIASIPEYVHHNETGLLAGAEDPQSIADLIEDLYFDSELFERLSADGAKWMHQNCGQEATVGREIEVIWREIANANL
ncbi:glycosyltransferase family 4 protein [Corynebacterium glutamicum]|uniref:glycosyltransferase family 4 protein n=1 Tax=Corynebacterium glutamicum TaxID=1718 RepID=UPI0009458037|nr:glycosyltransferase family 4 protein [Corynebacterium glutamicum]OKX86073.1 hypothetical protein AUO96_09570 [Corynebacterium glutamicum]QDX74619.1 hypothetical protein AKL15_02030 [Corynebacterium glutamicum]QDX77381.1 hypothetical protein AKL16_02035 [Corynebacterium glutamicum]TWS34493.1 hypothetical protein AKJ19_08320 [Corynebacterium glutamicum]TWS38047.1 hypothetical protein AKJ20_00315 [Corynebacterium glutamicum]